MKKLAKCVATIAFLFSVAGCMQTAAYRPVDSFGEYTQRTDKVALSAGDAQEVNLRIHEIDPWPRHAGNKHIPVNGQRMADAVKRYREHPPQPMPLVGTTGGSSSGGEK